MFVLCLYVCLCVCVCVCLLLVLVLVLVLNCAARRDARRMAWLTIAAAAAFHVSVWHRQRKARLHLGVSVMCCL